MAKFPEPPGRAQLLRIGPQLRVLPVGTELWRIYFLGGNHPVRWNGFRFYGPLPSARFDHHLSPAQPQQRGILYAATSIVTCLAEVFQETHVVDISSRDPWLAGFALTAPVVLHDLTGSWPTVAGASMAVNSGPRGRARRWSQAIYDAYDQVQGLWYCSSMHANQPAVAIYERAEGALPAVPLFHRALADPVLLSPLRTAAQVLGYRLV